MVLRLLVQIIATLKWLFLVQNFLLLCFSHLLRICHLPLQTNDLLVSLLSNVNLTIYFTSHLMKWCVLILYCSTGIRYLVTKLWCAFIFLIALSPCLVKTYFHSLYFCIFSNESLLVYALLLLNWILQLAVCVCKCIKPFLQVLKIDL